MSDSLKESLDTAAAAGANAQPERSEPMTLSGFSIPIPCVRALPFPLSLTAVSLVGKGVNEMKPAQFKYGIVSVREDKTPKRGDSIWLLRYIDPVSGADVRRRMTGLTKEEVRAVAENLTREAYQGNGYLAGRPKAPTLEDGLVEAARLSRGNKHTKARASRESERFLAFMVQHYPGARTWDALRPGMVESYVRELEARGLAHDSIRLALVPVRYTWARMWRDYPDLVKAPTPIRQAARPQTKVECLEACEVAALIDWLKANRPALWPLACLQGLAGLRSWEALSIRAQDVDFDKATVMVTDTPQHKVKTQSSNRTIPVCGEALAALREAAASQKVRPMSGELFTGRKGGPWKADALTHRWTFSLRRAAADLGNPRLAAIPARKLRAFFATAASRLGVPDGLLKRYLGHKGGDMLNTHYRAVSLDELRAVSTLFEGWRDAEKAPGLWQHSGNLSASAVAGG